MSSQLTSTDLLIEGISQLIPVGTILPYYGTTAPNENYLICDGSSFNAATYPKLHELIPTDKVPDLRECTLVGVGENTTFVDQTQGVGNYIQNHDTFTLGQFKDDQLQDHTHTYFPAIRETSSWIAAGGGRSGVTENTSNPNTGRHGTVTRGKEVGVTYIIRAA